MQFYQQKKSITFLEIVHITMNKNVKKSIFAGQRTCFTQRLKLTGFLEKFSSGGFPEGDLESVRDELYRSVEWRLFQHLKKVFEKNSNSMI